MNRYPIITVQRNQDFARLQKQLNLNPELRESYDTIVKAYLDENIFEEVKDDDNFENVHRLPHRAVIRNTCC